MTLRRFMTEHTTAFTLGCILLVVGVPLLLAFYVSARGVSFKMEIQENKMRFRSIATRCAERLRTKRDVPPTLEAMREVGAMSADELQFMHGLGARYLPPTEGDASNVVVFMTTFRSFVPGNTPMNDNEWCVITLDGRVRSAITDQLPPSKVLPEWP